MDPDPPPAVNRRTSATRMKEQLGVIILTTFGIVQGAVLADLAVVVANSAKEFVAAQWFMALAAFGLIIVIWSHTVAESLALSWVPNFPDIVAPFVAGALEFYLNHAILLGLAPWVAGATAVAGLLLVAYPIIEQLARTEPENAVMLEHLRAQRRRGVVLATGGLAINALCGAVAIGVPLDLTQGGSWVVVLLVLAWVGASVTQEAQYFNLINVFGRNMG